MRFLTQFGAVMIIGVGAIFSLQGANILPGSFMTGQIEWLVIGIVMIAVGIALLVATRRRAPV